MTLETEDMVMLRALASGALTLAELEGMTQAQAEEIAGHGVSLADAGRLEEARVVFEGLTASNLRDSAAWGALGTVYQKLGRMEDALAAYDTCVQLDPENPVALVNRGELRLRRGDAAGLEDVARALHADREGRTSAGRRALGLMKALTLAAARQAAHQGQ
jgi:Flp pilus assembly protein TadD